MAAFWRRERGAISIGQAYQIIFKDRISNSDDGLDTDEESLIELDS